MIKRIFYLFLLAFVFNSCCHFVFNTRTIFKPKGYSAKYTGVATGLDSLIRINGYYLSDTIIDHTTPGIYTFLKDTIGIKFSKELLLLYNNGIACYFYITPYYFNENRINKWLDFCHIVLNKWGVYNIVGDSIIKVENLVYVGLPLEYHEKQYQIVSDTVLKSLFTKYETGEIEIENRYLYFHPYPDRFGPELNPYLKKRWYWNKEAYKKMKEEKKRNKKKK